MDPETIETRALWFEGVREAALRPEQVLPPGPGEVRVRAVSSALSQGTEMLVYRGQVPAELPLDLPTLVGSFAFPIKYGYAAVGRICEIGAGVTGHSPSDLVFVHHPHQAVFNVPAAMLVPMPEGLDPLLGVFMANLETAVNVLLDTPVHLGETTLVFGQGTVGLLITQLLRRAGVRVIAVEPVPHRRQLASRVGADEVLTPADSVPELVRELTNGRGADVAVEVSGAGSALQSALESVATEGTVVAVSWYGTKPVALSLGGNFHRGRVQLRSSQVGRINPALGARWDQDRRMSLVRELLPTMQLRELVTHTVSFEDAPTAYQLVDEHPESTVQVVLTYE